MPEKATIKLPAKEPFLANAVLSCLQKWKDAAQARNPHRPWEIKQMDLNQLQEWVSDLHQKWNDTREDFERHGYEVIEQPTIVQQLR